MAKSKSKHKSKGQGKPQGATYADVLARNRAIQAGLEKYAADKAMQIETDIGVQRAMWLMVCSIADAFGIGPERMMRDFFPAFEANRKEYECMKAEVDEEYANEKIRQRAEQVSGQNIAYLYEHEMREAGLTLDPETDSFRKMTNREWMIQLPDDELADFMRGEKAANMEWLKQEHEMEEGSE